MPILPSIQGNEQVAYDMSRAHSADIFFIKMRYGMWTAIIGIGGFLAGHLLGVMDINLYGTVWGWFGGH